MYEGVSVVSRTGFECLSVEGFSLCEAVVLCGVVGLLNALLIRLGECGDVEAGNEKENCYPEAHDCFWDRGSKEDYGK